MFGKKSSDEGEDDPFEELRKTGVDLTELDTI